MADSKENGHLEESITEDSTVLSTTEYANQTGKRIQSNSQNTSFATAGNDGASENTKNYSGLSSWLFLTCMISAIPSISYLMCVFFVKGAVFEPHIFLHEIAFFSIVLLTTMIRTVFMGSEKKKYKRLYIIGATAIVMEVISFVLFTLVVVSEMVETISLRDGLFPVAVVICVASLILGGIAEYTEDLAK